ncbi:hypothetical protein PoB_002356600 [Plakobranchus ocellatus]|uniref:Uncharacterized protein n=1 Tax=Plakobranchus ocellatus TaxID=259542 RepID=A0AAV3ZRC6_9GAST|nr:hypothetical protein PoB_002356600 [Plakobranchus ocellatus]
MWERRKTLSFSGRDEVLDFERGEEGRTLIEVEALGKLALEASSQIEEILKGSPPTTKPNQGTNCADFLALCQGYFGATSPADCVEPLLGPKPH